MHLGNRIMAALQQQQQHTHAAATASAADADASNARRIMQVFRAPWVTSGLADASAIFVVGMPRSGSTLVEQMLASHSQV
jgi:hypothetical protein